MSTLQPPAPSRAFSLSRLRALPLFEPGVSPGRRELAGAAVLFLVLAFAVFGWYAFHGPFVADDWLNSARYYFHPDPGFWGAVDNYQTPSRPVAAVYVSLTYAVLGNHFHAHLVLAVLLTAFLSVAFFAFLRTVGLGRVLAIAIAALLLVFPSSDSTRFWVTGSQISLFIGLYLVGTTIAIVACRRYGARPTVPAVLTQILASALVVVAVAGYEIVAPAVLLSFVLYWWAGGPKATWRWLLDAVPTVLVLILYTQKFGGGGAHGMQLLTNVRTVADGAVSVLGYTLVPFRTTPRWTVFGVVVAVVLIILAVRRFAPATPSRDAVVRWLRPILLAVAGTAVGYAMIIPVAERYPLYAPGVQNRTNCFAALGLSALAVFVLAALAAMIVAVVPWLKEKTRAPLRLAVAVVLVLGMLAISTVRINEDRSRWEMSATVQAQILDAAHALVPSPPPDVTIFTSPYPGYSAPSLPIFGGGGNNDEVSAFQVSYGLPNLRAFPLLDPVGITCGPKSMSTPDAGNSETDYGKAVLIDMRRNIVYTPQDMQACVDMTTEMKPFGPVNLSDEW